MLAILSKEIKTFFSSPIGYLVVGVFLVINGLFLWVFKGDFNILDYGFSNLSSFYLLAPWVFVFLIPAVTMRSFSDEKKQGTLELLLTKPISKLNIVLGKYFGALLLIVIAIIPTLLYVYSINELTVETDIIDYGSIIGSYLGLLLLACVYTAIGVFSSTLTDNQIVAFLIAVVLCLLFYIGFEGLADLSGSNLVEQLGLSYHYNSLGRGVIDSRNVIYFLSVSALFILLTTHRIHQFSSHKINFKKLGISLVVLILLNVFSFNYFNRVDITTDQKYTLSDTAKELIDKVDSPVIIDVFLEGEGFTSEFKRLQRETKYLLEEISSQNSNIFYSFINPLEDESTREQTLQVLMNRGMTPMQVQVNDGSKTSKDVVIPWALASYNDITVKIPLIKNNIGSNQQELVSNSVQQLEYHFTDALKKLIEPKQKKIAVLQGNSQLETIYISDFLKTIRDYYYIAPFTLDSIAHNPTKTLKQLNDFDMILSAKPTEAFSEQEKYALDQFTMNGGKSLWLIDKVAIEKDSLYNEKGENVAIPRDLNLTDFFFKYGIRINGVLTEDLYSAPITLAIGEGSETQFQPLRWPYSPLAKSENNHPITSNIDMVKFDFANQIDTLKNSLNQTILLKSSDLSRLATTPKLISLEEVTKEPNPETYNNGNKNLAVLLEGEFTSVYKNRVKPFKINKGKDTSNNTKMIVIADGDVIKNEVSKNQPLELGFERFSGRLFGNKEFLLNCVNYLLDDDGLLDVRSKTVEIAFLDQEKITAERTKWQLINIALPIVLLSIFGFVFNFYRRKKFAS